MDTHRHKCPEKLSIKKASLGLRKLVIRKKNVTIKIKFKKSSSLYLYNRLPLYVENCSKHCTDRSKL